MLKVITVSISCRKLRHINQNTNRQQIGLTSFTLLPEFQRNEKTKLIISVTITSNYRLYNTILSWILFVTKLKRIRKKKRSRASSIQRGNNQLISADASFHYDKNAIFGAFPCPLFYNCVRNRRNLRNLKIRWTAIAVLVPAKNIKIYFLTLWEYFVVGNILTD